jgi:hypothetical protein
MMSLKKKEFSKLYKKVIVEIYTNIYKRRCITFINNELEIRKTKNTNLLHTKEIKPTV